MKFNPDHIKRAQEIIFSRKKTVSIHPVSIHLVNSTETHKHLGIILGSTLSYNNHLQSSLVAGGCYKHYVGKAVQKTSKMERLVWKNCLCFLGF